MEKSLKNNKKNDFNFSNLKTSVKDTKLDTSHIESSIKNSEKILKNNPVKIDVKEFLKETEEINDIVFFDQNGKVYFFNSSQNTLDIEYLSTLSNEFKY